MCSPVLKHKLRLVFIFLINLTENVEVLLRHKARPYMKDDSDETALITAIRHGYTECIHLLEAGADIQQFCQFHHSPLHDAREKCQVECVRFLLEHGADPEAESCPGFTPLYIAASRSPECLNLILSHKVRINTQGDDGVTPLMRCAKYGTPACAEILLSHGADPNLRDSEGRTALDIARDCGNSGIADLLETAAKAR